MLYAVGGGRPPAGPVAVTYPAHWRPVAVDALRDALAAMPEFGATHAGARRLRRHRGADRVAERPGGAHPRRHRAVRLRRHRHQHHPGRRRQAATHPLGPTVRHTDLSGDLVDQALLTHVINDLSAAGTIDLSGTSAIGSLSALRAQCRGAKERLSTAGRHRAGGRTARASQRSAADPQRARRSDAAAARRLRGRLAGHVGAQRSSGRRSRRRGVGGRRGAHPDHHHDAVRALPSAGHHDRPARVDGRDRRRPGGRARHGRRRARRRWPPRPRAAAAAAATAMAPEVGPQLDEMRRSPARSGALAWSDADDVPDVAPTDPYDYAVAGRDRRVPTSGRRCSSSTTPTRSDRGAAAVVPQAGGGDGGRRARGPGGTGGRGAVRHASDDTTADTRVHHRAGHDHDATAATDERRARRRRPATQAPPPRTVTAAGAAAPVVTVTQEPQRPRRPARRHRHRRRSRRPSPHRSRRPSRDPATAAVDVRRCRTDHPGSAVRSEPDAAAATRALARQAP